MRWSQSRVPVELPGLLRCGDDVVVHASLTMPDRRRFPVAHRFHGGLAWRSLSSRLKQRVGARSDLAIRGGGQADR